MKKQISLKIISFIFLSMLMLSTYAENIESNAASPPDLTERYLKSTIDQFLQANHIPGMAVALIVDGKSYVYQAGYQDKEKLIPVSDKTIFDIGSITKIMTCILLTQEVDLAKMSLDDSLRKYLPELPKKFDEITLQQLATHTSSLPFLTPDSINEHDELINYLSQWTSSYTPGNKWIYSNLGIGLLSYAVEGSAIRDFDDLYWRHITSALGMKKIGTILSDEEREDYATGYDQNNQPVQLSTIGLFPGAGNLKMAASDMQRFLSAAVGLPGTPERVFYPLRMTQAAYLRLYNREQGLGWEIHSLNSFGAIKNLLNESNYVEMGPLSVREIYERAKFDGNTLIDKTGTTNGFHAYIAVIPNKKSGIFIFANKRILDPMMVKMGREILFKLTHLTA